MAQLEKLVVLLALSLLPLPAHAAGISGGIAGIGAVAIATLVMFAVVWLGVWLIVRASRKPGSTSGRAWLLDPSIPIGLRGLAVTQYGLAPLYGYGALIQCIMPSHYLNGRVHPEVVQSILFCTAFAALALAFASAILHQRNPRGFRRGAALGWLCLLNGALAWALHGRYGIEWLSVAFGAALLALLHWRYRGYFGCEERSESFRKLTIALRLGAAVVAVPILLGVTGSLLLTTVFPHDEDDARAVLRQVADVMREYRDTRGDWPESLDELDPAVKRRYRWNEIEYLPEEQELWMDVRIVTDPDLTYRLTFGLRGNYAEELARMGHRLR